MIASEAVSSCELTKMLGCRTGYDTKGGVSSWRVMTAIKDNKHSY